MINFKKLFETVYEPRSGDEKNFKDKHVIAKHKYPVETESQFTSGAKKAKRKADYDEGDDASVYEAAEVHTKRADKEAVIVRAVDPKTGQSKSRVVQRRAGEIKIGEEVELEEGTVGHGKYTITTGPKMSGMGEGGPSHVVAKRAKMAKLGVPHHDDPGEYGHTVKVTVKNNETGATTHHHVYQRDTDRGSKEALVSTRTIGAVHAKQKEHENALHNYLSGKKVSSIKEDLDEKVVNPYAIGMAAAMKQAGDTPPLKKSTIVKGHEIAKSIKKEAMDPVGKHDADIDNDGDTDKSDKYLINRRKAIGKALRKEEVEQIDELSPNTLHSYIKKSAAQLGQKSKHLGDIENRGKISPAAEKVKKTLERKTANRLSGITGASGRLADKANYDMHEDVDSGENTAGLDNGSYTNYVKSNKTQKIKNNPEDVVKEENDKSISTKTFNKYKNGNKGPESFKEESEEINELKKSTLASYTQKAAGSLAGSIATAAISGHKNQRVDRDVSRTIKNRMSGITKATNTLAKEEAEQIDELSKKTLGSYVKKAADSSTANRARSDILARKAIDPNTSAQDSDRLYGAMEKAFNKHLSRRAGIEKAVNRLTKEDLDEAFKVGSMKLHDGSAVTLTRESVDALNGLFHQLTASNKAKMEERLMSSSKGFSEILSFAKEAI